MKLKYKHRLFLWFGIIFLSFTIGIVIFEQSRAKRYKTEILEEKLNTYANVVNNALRHNEPIDSLLKLFPHNIRLTLIDKDGRVFYDNAFREVEKLENHANRPEILKAGSHGSGSSARKSATKGIEYLYYAKDFGNYYIRVALPYDIQIQRFLRADNGFLYVTILLFFIALTVISFTARMFGKSIAKLRDFTIAAEEGSLHNANVVFPDDELGEIGKRIVQDYQELESRKKTIDQEREKLLQHILSSGEGVCFYTSDRKVEFYNGLFMQYLNILLSETVVEPNNVLNNPEFSEINTFLSSQHSETYYETVIKKQGKNFAVQVNIFADNSFEITIRDITKQEKTRQLKQEMTGNIAHELRTPVTSIRGYLETILEQPLDAEKQRQFISKAFKQTLSLSALISDMELLTKIEEAPDFFRMNDVNILSVVENICEDLELPLKENSITVDVNIPADTIVKGNENLLYSVFRNLTDNAIKYAGKEKTITISCYNSDDNYYYFSFSDNGIGVQDEQHLSRLFERFYNISEGRTRDAGGSGLGLSIVKNAIIFHKGAISVKNRVGGGLEFLFQLPKKV
ncbi:MAG: HAMP domain-containing histidine kinase [Bacteroidales bacterium]|jgi:signal transduction histidine kinase|nr:HAMP domain-containing histidine kinase [Bacteroidales bacterium]